MRPVEEADGGDSSDSANVVGASLKGFKDSEHSGGSRLSTETPGVGTHSELP